MSERRAARRPLVSALFADDTDAALAVLDELDAAWRSATAAPTPPRRVLDDVLLLSRGDVGRLRQAAEQALLDPRDLFLSADHERARLGHAAPDRAPRAPRVRTRRPRGVLLRLVTLATAVAVVLTVGIAALTHRRDTGSRDRAWDAVGAYTAALALTPTADPAAVFRAAVPQRSVRLRYFTGDLAVAWTVVDPAGGVVACVELRSVSGEEAYGAAWAGTGETAVRRSVAGSGCGAAPGSVDAARRAAAG